MTGYHKPPVLFTGLLFIVTIIGSLVLPGAIQADDNPLAKFVLSDTDIPGFKVTRGPNYYRPESLWNYINGGALPYLDYGVGDVATYTGNWKSDAYEIVVDIYDMADSLGAFGIYSNERFPEYDYRDIGTEGYLTENTLCFWKDRYYIKVISQSDEPSSLTPLIDIGKAIDSRIEGGSLPGYLSLFPHENRQAKTEAFLAKNVLGQDYLSDAFAVNYKNGDTEYQLYLILGENVETAQKNIRSYKEFLREYGEMTGDTVAVGDESFIGKESWYGAILFVRKGSYIVGSVGLADLSKAESHIRTIIAGLK
ncbi:DUF6599 family protein [Candidatus Latescibacterota bacterium]